MVLHKRSSFTADEIAGCQSAGNERGLDWLELTWITAGRRHRDQDAGLLAGERWMRRNSCNPPHSKLTAYARSRGTLGL